VFTKNIKENMMKNILYVVSLLLILHSTALPGGVKNKNGILTSSSLSILNVIAAAGTSVSVPVKVQGLSNIGAISLKIPYNSALTFVSLTTSTGLTFISNAAGGVISIAWVDFTGVTPQTFPDGSALLNLNFTYSGGSAPVTFNTSMCQIADEQAVPLNVTFNNGGVTPFTGTFPALSIGNATALNNTAVTLPLNAQTFNSISSFTFNISYNTSTLTYTGLTNTYNGITISNSAAAGVLTLSWSGASSITISNGLLANLNFTYLTGTGPVSFNSALSEVINSSGQIISGVVYTNGSVAQAIPPVAPVLSSPLTGAVNQPVSLALTWGSVPTAQSYRVQVSTDSLFATTFKDSSGITTTTLNITSLNNSTKYFWRVNASYLGLAGNYSTVSNFTTIIASPTVPVLTSPANNSVNQPLTITFNWNSIPIAASYRIQVATDSLFTSLILNDSTVTTNSKTLTGLLNLKKYYWRVNAKNLAGTSAYSIISNFTTITVAPAAPILTSPSTGSINQPITLTLNWGTVTGAVSYRVQLATDSLFVSLVVNDSTVTSTNKSVSGLGNNTIYFWRVNAKNVGGTSSWSAVWNFKTLSLPTVSGKVLYASTNPQGVKNVIVTLNPGGYTSTTDVSGSFNFLNVPNGSYTVSASTANAWSNNEINATDALWIAQAFVGLKTFSGIQNLAADVNLLAGVNNTDALLIVRRWAGLTTSFPSGDWVFTYPAVTVADSNLNLTVNCLFAGDVNASSNMSALPKQNFISFEENNLLNIKQNEEFDIPVTINQNVNLGAMNLSFNYPADLASFEGAFFSADNIITNEQDGNVKIAWFDISGGQKPVTLKSGNNVIVLRFKSSNAFNVGSRFSVQFDKSACEFASADGNILPSVQLQFPAASLMVPTESSLMQNYPNPFNPTTTIRYSLAYESNVTLKIFNSIGQSVREFNEGIKQQGNNEVNFNAAGLASGIYLFSISAQSVDGKNNFSAVKKMILMK